VGLWEHGRIEAADAERGPDYVCPNCRRPLILRKGQIVIHHFAHKPPTSCTWASGETQAHLKAKTALRDGFVARGLRAEVEVVVVSQGGDRRADVLVWSADGQHQAAIEVQHQAIEFAAITRRTKAYMAVNTPVAWVSLMHPKLWDDAERAGDHWVVPRYSVRPWERWAHTYGFGELWFFDPDAGQLWRGELKAHMIEVPSSSWYDSYGNEESAGGFSRTSRRWRELHLHGPYQPHEVRLRTIRRKPYTGKNYDVPGGWAARLEPLDAPAAAKAPLRRPQNGSAGERR
jgi:competence protein CoiA